MSAAGEMSPHSAVSPEGSSSPSAAKAADSKDHRTRRSSAAPAEPSIAAAALIEVAMRRMQCPLSHQLLSEPVVASDGNTYERAALEAWLEAGNTTSPVTEQPLTSTTWYPNAMLKQLLQDVMLQGRDS